MDWKKEAAEKLRWHEARKNAVESMREELESLRCQVDRIRSATADGTPVVGGGSRREEQMLNRIVKQDALVENLRRTRKTVERVEKALQLLEEDERRILDRFYINPAKGNVEKLCREICAEKSTVYRRRDEALRKFTVALYGVTES